MIIRINKIYNTLSIILLSISLSGCVTKRLSEEKPYQYRAALETYKPALSHNKLREKRNTNNTITLSQISKSWTKQEIYKLNPELTKNRLSAYTKLQKPTQQVSSADKNIPQDLSNQTPTTKSSALKNDTKADHNQEESEDKDEIKRASLKENQADNYNSDDLNTASQNATSNKEKLNSSTETVIKEPFSLDKTGPTNSISSTNNSDLGKQKLNTLSTIQIISGAIFVLCLGALILILTAPGKKN